MQARHLLRRRPGVQGQAARAGRAGLRLRVQALRRPGQHEPDRGRHGRPRIRRPGRAAQARARRARSRSTTTATIEGLRALDRYTMQFTARASRGRASSRPWPAATCSARVAREVVEFYGDQIGAHPVGTGPFRLKQWRRSSRIVLERNPDFREMLYDAEPAADDAEGQAILARFKGRRLPMVDASRSRSSRSSSRAGCRS